MLDELQKAVQLVVYGSPDAQAKQVLAQFQSSVRASPRQIEAAPDRRVAVHCAAVGERVKPSIGVSSEGFPVP
jgi:hypothetical protein